MGRVSARLAREARIHWAERLTEGAGHRAPRREEPPPEDDWGRGMDYAEADQRWVCNRKKAYGVRWLAERVAARMNATNQSSAARPGFEGVRVVPYLCRRCGEYHIGR